MQSIEFYKDVKAVCDIAGQPALAESIINLHKTCNESIDFDDEFGDYYSDRRAEEAEQDAEAENYQEMTEEGVQGVLNRLGLTVVNKWYDGNRSRPVFDCQKGNGETICVWTEPPYEAKVWFKDREPGNNRFSEDIITLDSLESELNDLLDEISPTEEELNAAAEKISAPDYHAEGAYEDLTDLGNDFESVQLESVNADAVSYEVVVADLNVKSRVSVKIISEDTALLNTIFNYFISVSNSPAQIYHLADNPNIYMDGMWRHYYEDYQTPYLNTIVNVQTPNNLLPNPARHLGLNDIHIEKLKESSLQSIVLDNVKRFVNQAIAYGAAHPEQNLSVVDIPNPHMEIAEDNPREFAYDEAVELYKDIKAICDIAGKPALAEAVIKLHKAYHPVLEAEGVAEQIFADYLDKKGITELDAVKLERILNDMVYEKRISSTEADKLWTTVMSKAQPNMEAAEKAHKVPRDIAVAFNDYVADTLYTRPETHDQLKESEFEFNWNWLDDEAEDVIRVWNATHDPSALYRLLENADENSACMRDGI